jgi:hypothetical protein
MGYSVNDLKSYFVDMYTTQPNPINMTQHFKDFASLYDDYAKDVVDSVASNGLIVTGKSSFEDILSGYALVEDVPSLTIYSTFIENACIAYWNSCVFATLSPPVSWDPLFTISITAMSPNSMKNTLATAFVSSNGKVPILSTAISGIIHSATSTVSLTLSGTISAVPVSSTASLSP